MEHKSLVDKCRTNTNIDTDTFVGIYVNGDDVSVNFPLGYHISADEKSLRKDILLLMSTLSRNIDKKESEINTNANYNYVNLPIQAYLFLIADFYSRGYFKERETEHVVAKRGKINWGRTVKTCRAYIQDDEVFYLDYVTKKNKVNDNEIITLIHEGCVYESFRKIGWLFSSFMPEKPRLDINKKKKYYAAVVKRTIAETFNDKDKQLFRNMLAILDSIGDDGSANEFRYGTYRFEYVWESMIDKAYGIKNKTDYFPRTRWIVDNKEYRNASLEPDTIMLRGNSVYVLDAKYYKFGWSGAPGHLPDSSSISKQITYGEYIAETGLFADEDGHNPNVFNAFLMPYDSFGKAFHTEEYTHYIGTAISDWKSSDGTKPYEQVLGILIDVKALMENYSHSENRIIKLAELIEDMVEAYDR